VREIVHEKLQFTTVAKRAQLHIWRKQASRSWFEKHEEQLSSCTIIERPGRKQLTIETVAKPGAAQQLLERYGGAVHPLPDDWEQQAFATARIKPLQIGKRLTVSSDGPAADHHLHIPAGAAFGTGEHATTAMSLRILERVTRQLPAGWRMLDAGTGSGILALAAAKFGAAHVLAIDNDPLAISTAKKNAQLNSTRTVEFRVGDVTQKFPGRFQIITANLYSELLAQVLPQFRRSLTRDGVLILSGVMRHQERQLSRALQQNGFTIRETRRRGKWVAIAAPARRPAEPPQHVRRRGVRAMVRPDG
jgi:ribosomal protein L11 methyltransferase